MHDHSTEDADDEERNVVKDGVAQHLSKRGVAHHVLAENAHDALAEEDRRVERMSGNGVDEEEPHCDRRRADETGDHAFTQKVVRPLSHRCPLVQLDATAFRGKYPTRGYIPSETPMRRRS